MRIDIEVFDASRVLLGLDYQLLNMVEELDEDRQPIIEQFHSYSIGLVFFTIVISRRRRT